MKPMKVWIASLLSRERRKAVRQKSLPMVAYYWDGAAPAAHSIRDINSTGLYLLTDQRWYPGTMITMTLQRTGAAETDPERAIAVMAKVIRAGVDGAGLEFVPTQSRAFHRAQDSTSNTADVKTIDRFLRRLQMDRGQALPEYALLMPLVFLWIVRVGVVEVIVIAWITVAKAARGVESYAKQMKTKMVEPGIQVQNCLE
jgi:hypothetical protein